MTIELPEIKARIQARIADNLVVPEGWWITYNLLAFRDRVKVLGFKDAYKYRKKKKKKKG